MQKQYKAEFREETDKWTNQHYGAR
jgi:hypothetical protein